MSLARADARMRASRRTRTALNDVRLEPHGFFRRIPLAPHQMRDSRTRTEDAIVLCHLGVPRLARDGWTLTVDGLVGRPLAIRFDDLMRHPQSGDCELPSMRRKPPAAVRTHATHLQRPVGRRRLADILADCEPARDARFIWSYGADHGEFSGVAVDAYLKDLPLARAQSDVLIAYEMNGAPLAAEHGFPARLVVPGFYGTNSVKWLRRMTLSEARAQGPFTTRWYNDPVLDGAGRETGETPPGLGHCAGVGHRRAGAGCIACRPH